MRISMRPTETCLLVSWALGQAVMETFVSLFSISLWTALYFPLLQLTVFPSFLSPLSLVLFLSCLLGFFFICLSLLLFLTVFPPASSCRIWKSSIFPPKLLDFNASKGLSPQSNTNVEIFVELLMTEAFSDDQLLG